jgi:hypothetical protein
LKKIGITIGILFMAFPVIFIILLLLTPAYEAISGTESKLMQSAGNCRIKNINFAIENNIPYVYFLKHMQTELGHVLAVDNNNTYFDESNGKKSHGNIQVFYDHNYKVIYIAEIKNGILVKSSLDNLKDTTFEKYAYPYYTRMYLFVKKMIEK